MPLITLRTHRLLPAWVTLVNKTARTGTYQDSAREGRVWRRNKRNPSSTCDRLGRERCQGTWRWRSRMLYCDTTATAM